MADKQSFDLLEIKTDGGARGNPGPAAIGVYAYSGENEVFSISQKIGETTNNVAEYSAVIKALEHIQSQNIYSKKLRFILDSELIVKQITGIYKVKQPHLQNLRQEVVKKIKNLKNLGNIELLSFMHVKREKNKEADSLVNKALDS